MKYQIQQRKSILLQKGLRYCNVNLNRCNKTQIQQRILESLLHKRFYCNNILLLQCRASAAAVMAAHLHGSLTKGGPKHIHCSPSRPASASPPTASCAARAISACSKIPQRPISACSVPTRQPLQNPTKNEKIWCPTGSQRQDLPVWIPMYYHHAKSSVVVSS